MAALWEVGADGRVHLFRAVDDVELKALQETGQFGGSPSGIYRKGFFFKREDAETFRVQQIATGGPETTVVHATAPATLVDKSHRHNVAMDGPGCNILNEELGRVTFHE